MRIRGSTQSHFNYIFSEQKNQNVKTLLFLVDFLSLPLDLKLIRLYFLFPSNFVSERNWETDHDRKWHGKFTIYHPLRPDAREIGFTISAYIMEFRFILYFGFSFRSADELALAVFGYTGLGSNMDSSSKGRRHSRGSSSSSSMRRSIRLSDRVILYPFSYFAFELQY